MNQKELEKLAFELKCAGSSMEPRHLVKTRYPIKDANTLTKALLQTFEVLGGHAKRINAAGVARGVKVTQRGYTDVMGVTHATKTAPNYTPSGAKSEPDLSGSIPVKGETFSVEVKIEVKWGRDTLKRKQAEALQKHMKAGCIIIIASEYEPTSEILERIRAGHVNEYKNTFNLWDGKIVED